MKTKVMFFLFCLVCAAVPIAAQTVPENMVLIPEGKFWMGRTVTMVIDTINTRARDSMDDVPANHVYLDAFYIDKYEVTNEDYARFLAATGGKAPWHWPQGNIPPKEERFPIANVNWFEATDYCKWAGKRLPTEAEWEKAARGGLDRKLYFWGDDDIDTIEFRRLPPASSATKSGGGDPENAGSGGPVAVGSFPANGYGLYDVGGNVSEWLSDWFYDNYYPFMPKQNPKGPDKGLYRSVRGANWASGGGGDGFPSATAYFRNYSDPDLRITTIGFRCAKDAG
jgi:iron(II)-dependent oxidoreductase